MADDYFGYFAVSRDKKDRGQSFAFGNEKHVRTSVEGWGKKKDSPKGVSDTAGKADKSEPDFTHASALTDTLAASVDFGLAQFELIEASTLAPLIIELAMLSGQIIRPTVEAATKIEDTEGAELYGLNESQFADLLKRHRRFSSARKGFERFPSATFLSIVATFDTLIVDVMAKMLKLQKDWLDRSERSISLSRLSKASSIDELIKEQIAEELYLFSRGSHAEQAGYIKKNFGIDIPTRWKRWPDYIEIFERRNLVAHGEVKFNNRYVSICKKEGHKGSEKLLDEEVKLSRSYLNQSLEVLIEFAILLSFSLFKKFASDKENEAFTNLNEAAFKLIQNGRYLVSERICDYALSLEKTKITDETKLMLLVNRASALRHAGQEEEAKKLLDSTDWSAASDVFRISVASVRGDTEKFVELLPIVKATGSITSQSILEWPCFSFMLEDGNAKSAISDIFGVSVGEAEAKNVEEETSTEALSSPESADTMH